MRWIAHFELFECLAERLAEPQKRFRAEADRRDPRPVHFGAKWIRNLGERIHLGPPLCDPADTGGRGAGHHSVAARASTCPVASITQDSGPRFPVRGRHSPTGTRRKKRRGTRGGRATATSIHILCCITESTSNLFALFTPCMTGTPVVTSRGTTAPRDFVARSAIARSAAACSDHRHCPPKALPVACSTPCTPPP